MLHSAVSFLVLIFGTLGPDAISGSGSADELHGGPKGMPALDNASDTITGGGGDDVIRLYGGPEDHGDGGDGDDTLIGGSGTDFLTGGGGDDSLSGGGAYDDIDGGPGNDTILGGAFNDVLRGGPGDDVIDGGSSVDYVLSGGPGDDQITGRVTAGWLSGGTGRDVLITPPNVGKNRFGFGTWDGTNAYGKGTHTTTIPAFRRGMDELFLVKARYTDGTPVTNPDTNGDGAISTGDKGWTVLPTANPILRFRGWNSTLFIHGKTFIEATDVSLSN